VEDRGRGREVGLEEREGEKNSEGSEGSGGTQRAGKKKKE
jgi:hypothetical protein